MDFCNKMDFLMKLTQMKNKELAAEMSVDRSLISLLRTGKRGIPQNKLHVRHMAESFSKRILTAYQRQALAEVSGLPSMRTEVSAEILALSLERWLLGNIDIVDHLLDGIKQDVSVTEEFSLPKITAPEGETFFFYGEEGKRDAFRFFISNLKEGIIGIFDNTDLNWINSDPAFAADIQALIKSHLNTGYTLTQILPPISNISCYTDSLRFLLPIYTRGNVNVFYYPRTMDMTRNITLIVAPGQCVSYSYGYNTAREHLITIVSTNKEFISAHAEQFREYLGLCRSALKVHREPPEFLEMMKDFFALHGDVCQKTLPLSTYSMPVELAEILAEQSTGSMWKESFQRVAKVIPSVEQRMANYNHIDISPLNSVEDIVAGKVPIACPHLNKNYPFYTPETYIMHLKNILRLMDTYKGYNFIPLDPKAYQGYNLMVNEGGMALLSHGQNHSPMIMEFRRPEIVLACKEHLMRIVDREGGLEVSRNRTKAQINALIKALEKAAQKGCQK